MRGTIRTDLAREARELHPELSGVTEENAKHGRISISRIAVETEEAAQTLGKARGSYITLDAPEAVGGASAVTSMLTHAIAEELTKLIERLSPEAPVLVAGLGNRAVTPDSLGPRTVERVYVTRHIKQYMEDALPRNIRAVSAIAPGVLGVTGLETLETVRGIAQRTEPALIIAVDSLAARRASRIGASVQLTDTGISPGAGIGNDRKGLSDETLGIPVVAIGAPLVVYAATIARDTVEFISTEHERGEDEAFMDTAERVIEERVGELIVTPKEIDTLVGTLSRVIADGINLALFGEAHARVRSLLA